MAPIPPPTAMYAELLTHIRQVSVTIFLSSPATSSTSVTLEVGSVMCVQHDGGTFEMILPAEVHSSPIKNFPYGQKEMSLRLRLADNAKLPEQKLDLADLACVPWSAEQLSAAMSFRCNNLRCQSVLIPARKVAVWKNLPSENWAEMMDFWHCHKPDPKHKSKAEDDATLANVKGYGANNHLRAESGTAFVDLTYLLVSPKDCAGIYISKDSYSLACSNCSTTLGMYDAPRNSYRINKWTLRLDGAVGEITQSARPAIYLSARLNSLIASQAVSRFVLYVKNNNDSECHADPPPILIWVFAPQSFISHTCATSRHAYSTLEDESTSSLSKTAAEKSIAVSKVFFQHIPTSLGNVLLNDSRILSAVEGVQLDADALQSITSDLERSNCVLPPSLRSFTEAVKRAEAEIWRVGWLARYTGG